MNQIAEGTSKIAGTSRGLADGTSKIAGTSRCLADGRSEHADASRCLAGATRKITEARRQRGGVIKRGADTSDRRAGVSRDGAEGGQRGPDGPKLAGNPSRARKQAVPWSRAIWDQYNLQPGTACLRARLGMAPLAYARGSEWQSARNGAVLGSGKHATGAFVELVEASGGQRLRVEGLS